MSHRKHRNFILRYFENLKYSSSAQKNNLYVDPAVDELRDKCLARSSCVLYSNNNLVKSDFQIYHSIKMLKADRRLQIQQL